MNGRSKEILRIREANKAVAVGKLLRGQLSSWQQFLAIDSMDLESMPRRNLKSGHHDVKKRLSRDIQDFCSKNFKDMTSRKLSTLYEAVKSNRGLEMPLQQFEEEFSPISAKALIGHPKHATVVISLWGLQFMYPEHYFSEDIRESLTRARSLSDQLRHHADLPHAQVKHERQTIADLIRGQQFSSRTCLLSCFNLIEAYLNGLAWEFSRESEEMPKLSNKKQNLITDTGNAKFREKILKYPEIISGRHLWDEKSHPVNILLAEIKPFRDALVHPSPFTTPERFGGHDKLQMLYRLDLDVAERCADLTYEIIGRVQRHLYGEQATNPPWLRNLEKLLKRDEVK